MVTRRAAGKRDHAGRMAQVLEPARNVLLLGTEALGREDRVGFGGRVDAQRFQKVRHRRVAFAAVRAVGQVLGHRRIEELSALDGQIAVEQSLVLEVVRAVHHGFPPSRPRSFRAARKRWTRTVDSFNPVMALTSRGVQSP